MFELKFVHGTEAEIVFFRVDRYNKRFWIASSKTDYKLVKTSWRNLFDKKKEIKQEIATRKLSDYEFKILIILEMAKNGYKEYGSSIIKTNK